MKTMTLGLISLLVFATPLMAQANPDRHTPFPAFKIAGNLYYVGTADLAVYLNRSARVREDARGAGPVFPYNPPFPK